MKKGASEVAQEEFIAPLKRVGSLANVRKAVGAVVLGTGNNVSVGISSNLQHSSSRLSMGGISRSNNHTNSAQLLAPSSSPKNNNNNNNNNNNHNSSSIAVMDKPFVFQRSTFAYFSDNTPPEQFIDRSNQGWNSVRCGKAYKPIGAPIVDLKIDPPVVLEHDGVNRKKTKRRQTERKTTTKQERVSLNQADLKIAPRRKTNAPILGNDYRLLRESILISDERKNRAKSGQMGVLWENSISSSLSSNVSSALNTARSAPPDIATQYAPISAQLRESPSIQWKEMIRQAGEGGRTDLNKFLCNSSTVVTNERSSPNSARGKVAAALTRSDPKSVCEDLSLGFGAFDTMIKDEQFKLEESLSILDSERKSACFRQFNSLTNKFDSLKEELQRMRSESKRNRKNVLRNKDENHSWLSRLVYSIHSTEKPTQEEVILLQTVQNVFHSNPSLRRDLETFRIVCRTLPPRTLRDDGAGRLLNYLASQAFTLSLSEYYSCLQDSNLLPVIRLNPCFADVERRLRSSENMDNDSSKISGQASKPKRRTFSIGVSSVSRQRTASLIHASEVRKEMESSLSGATTIPPLDVAADNTTRVLSPCTESDYDAE